MTSWGVYKKLKENITKGVNWVNDKINEAVKKIFPYTDKDQLIQNNNPQMNTIIETGADIVDTLIGGKNKVGHLIDDIWG